MATPSSLRADLEWVWARDTAVDPDAWTPECPSTGHCAVTALLVQEYTDAKTILRVVMPDGQSHYYNSTPDGAEVDLTRDQFDAFNPVAPAEERTKEYLLSNDETRRRWETLRHRLGRHWFGVAITDGGEGVNPFDELGDMAEGEIALEANIAEAEGDQELADAMRAAIGLGGEAMRAEGNDERPE